ncbi:MAG: TerB family tellurite resistance protein [Gammaproteobacteria bacterium]|nr:TerB family tellurite resistance protein [Gammaproteobacteria bacterium]
MAIADLKNVLRIFGGSDVSEDQQNELYKEVLLMTLARAANADVNIQTVEVDRIREILKGRTGQDFSAADIRVAAREELYAEATLRKYLGSVRSKMADKDRVDTVHALADVFRSDANISVLEVDFFNRVATALQVTAAEVAGLTAGDVA